MAKNNNSVLCAALSYVLIGIVWYFVDEQQRKDDFVRFHVRQSVALLILSVIVWVVGIILAFIPVIGWIISVLLSLGMLILWIMGIIGALTEKRNELPVVGGFAKNFTF